MDLECRSTVAATKTRNAARKAAFSLGQQRERTDAVPGSYGSMQFVFPPIVLVPRVAEN